jgi:hypothetical protein
MAASRMFFQDALPVLGAMVVLVPLVAVGLAAALFFI